MNEFSQDLNQKLRDAYGHGDKNELAKLYHIAANSCAENNIDETCFFLTQAYVFALELGLDTAHELHNLLVQHNRES